MMLAARPRPAATTGPASIHQPASSLRQRRTAGEATAAAAPPSTQAQAAAAAPIVMAQPQETTTGSLTTEPASAIPIVHAIPVAAAPMAEPLVLASSVHYPDLGRDDFLVVDEAGQTQGFLEDVGPEPSAPLLAEDRSSEQWPGGLEPSAPSFEGDPRQLEMTHQRPGASYASSVVQPQPHVPPIRASVAAAAPSSSQQRKLSPRASARLAQLRAKAEVAAAHEEAQKRAIKRGEMAPPQREPVQMVKHKVVPDDDLTDLAVRYGSSVASIKAANRRIVFEVLDNVVGEEITIPATRVPTIAPVDPVEDAARALRNKHFFAKRKFLEIARNATDTEAAFYLEDNEWDVERALEQWQEDVDWEKTQQHLPGGASSTKPLATFGQKGSKEAQPLINKQGAFTAAEFCRKL